MANVKTTIDSFTRGDTKVPAADQYAEHATHSGGDLPKPSWHGGTSSGGFAGQVDSYAPHPKLGAGGKHNRAATGHESET